MNSVPQKNMIILHELNAQKINDRLNPRMDVFCFCYIKKNIYLRLNIWLEN